MSNPGLGKGFVKFGTLAHRVLMLAHDSGTVQYSDIVEELGVSPNATGMVLTRLHRNRFLHAVGRTPTVDGKRTERVYAIEPKRRRPANLASLEPESSAQRTKRMRQRKRTAVASVFEWRGPYRPRRRGVAPQNNAVHCEPC